jgi:hypothetical protein
MPFTTMKSKINADQFTIEQKANLRAAAQRLEAKLSQFIPADRDEIDLSAKMGEVIALIKNVAGRTDDMTRYL